MATPPPSAEAPTAQTITAGAASPRPSGSVATDCVVQPELTEGRYFRDEKLNRSDTRF